ncbi:MAG: (2Fe-2S)-binding protein [Rhodobacteraceae bacterium]|nr:(2Fe-2S)-binding protein [Paracoccaceae bacterium]
MSNTKQLTLNINGQDEKMNVPSHRTLLEALRESGHIEVKCGCEKGDCGACAVLVDDVAVDSCLTLAWASEGKAITTVTGLGNVDEPHPLQTAFKDLGASQCGYCTPGMIIASKGLLNENPDPTDDEIRVGLSGNLCRCTGYAKILDAVGQAAEVMRREGEPS